MIRALDRADLVVVGAEAAGTDPHEVLEEADVGVLVALEGRLAAAPSVADAAAEALVTIAASRPFARANRAAAWLAAAHVAAVNGCTLDLDVALAVALVDGAAAGTRDEREVAAVLARHLPRPTRWRDRLAALVRTPERPRPPVRTCPLCRRVLTAEALWLARPWAVVPREHLISGCLRQHGVHDRQGNVAAAEPAVTGERAPLVCGGDDGSAFLALTGRGPVVLRRTTRPDRAVTYDLFVLDELPLSGLVGSWDRLLGEQEPVAQVAIEPRPLDPHQADLDWSAVQTVGTGT